MAVKTGASPTRGSTPRLSEAARHLVYPSTIASSVYPRVEQRLNSVGVQFDPWQQGFGTIALGLDSSGQYASTIGGVVASIPRQVGKTFTVGNLLIGLCLEFPGLRVIWTSHHLQTTGNTFLSMQAMVRRKKVWPHVAPGGIRLVNGEQRITFVNGSVIMFGARAMGFGRGMDKIDVEVFDEAGILPIRALEDMVPATNQAQHPHGALLFFIGTPPRPVDDGEAFTAKRQQAIGGLTDDDMVYVEFSAEPGADPDDRSQWPIMNPSYPSRTPLKSMLRMKSNLTDPDSWRREAMGLWDEAKRDPATIPAKVWNLLATDAPPASDAPPNALACDMSHERVVSIDGCWLSDGSAHVEVLALDTIDALGAVEWLVERAGRRIPVVIDSFSPAASLVPLLKSRRVKVIVVNSGPDMAKACGGFYDEVMAGRVTHADQKQLNDAVAGAKKRKIGDAGGWGWDRKDPTVNLAPLVAATLARFGAVVTKKRPPSGGRTATVLQ